MACAWCGLQARAAQRQALVDRLMNEQAAAETMLEQLKEVRPRQQLRRGAAIPGRMRGTTLPCGSLPSRAASHGQEVSAAKRQAAGGWEGGRRTAHTMPRGVMVCVCVCLCADAGQVVR